ncbi:MAG: FmdB family zinc ribbon protein [Acidimicrobiales bacterium]
MPTYDYLCETCGLGFELQQAFSEDTLEKCPTKKSGRGPEGCAKSGRGKVLKVFSAPGITFKGAGFYKNDSRGSSASKESPGSASSTSSSDSSSSSSSSESSTSKSESSKSESSTSKSKSESSTSKSKSSSSSSD